MRRVTITDKNGLHARPAADVTSVARKHEGNVYLVKEDKEGNAKSIMTLMTLGIICGDVVDIIAEGKDSDKIEQEIENIILNSDSEVSG